MVALTGAASRRRNLQRLQARTGVGERAVLPYCRYTMVSVFQHAAAAMSPPNRSFETDAQRRPFASLRPFPSVAAQLQ
ncbi:MAG TPA: hypothetical protein VIL30_05850, partial [Ramlibacter sp.]